MKLTLTPAQIATVRFALEQYADKYESRAEVYSEDSFWTDEVATARALETLFKTALDVEIESPQAKPEPAPEPELIVANAEAEVQPEAPVRIQPQPALLNAIDRCESSNAARDVLRNAKPAARREVAKFFGIPTNDLLEVITRRFQRAA